MTLKHSILKSIVADRKQFIPAFAGGVTWCVLRLLTYFGLNLTPYEQAELSAFLFLLVAAIGNGWALNATSDGTKQNQEKLKEVKPWVEVDGVPGPQTQSAVAQVVEQSKP